ncbi:PEP-CTERM sorting domain-containing protein [Microcystis aeruginosa FBCC-A68]
MSPVSEVTFNGTELLLDDAITLSPNNNPATTVVWDVTNIIASSFTGGIQDFSIVEAEDNDGAVLVVAYSNFSTEGLTSVILDGELSTLGDTVEFNFAPYTTGDFLVSLASSYSMQPSGQFTQIDVTTNSTKNRRLTTSAGGQDDGEDGNGALITVGGIGDNPANVDPNAQPDVTNPDDEYYNLALGNSANSAPFISQGDKYLSLTTQNQSNDDNVFGMFITSGFKITATPVPEPSMTLGIFGIGAIGALISRRGKKS